MAVAALRFMPQMPIHFIARGDYAACFGDLNYIPWYYGPDELADAASWTANRTWTTGKWDWPDGYVPTGISYLRSEVTMAWITDGASNTYMVGEKCMNPDCYLTGMGVGDNEGVFTGQVDDNYRISYYPPQQDTPGIDNEFLFGSAHAGVFQYELLRRFGSLDQLHDRHPDTPVSRQPWGRHADRCQEPLRLGRVRHCSQGRSVFRSFNPEPTATAISRDSSPSPLAPG